MDKIILFSVNTEVDTRNDDDSYYLIRSPSLLSKPEGFCAYDCLMSDDTGIIKKYSDYRVRRLQPVTNAFGIRGRND